MIAKESIKNKASSLTALPVMLGAVALQVLGAILLKALADQAQSAISFWIILGVGGVILLNVLRFVVWGYAHHRFPLSTTFPLSSLFFPSMLLVAFAYGDPIEVRQVIGAMLITVGSLWLNFKAGS